MLEANAKVTVTVKDTLGDTGEWKVRGDLKVTRSTVTSADHHGKADAVYTSNRKKYDPFDITRVAGDWDWDRKAKWLALNHGAVTVTELVFDDDGLPYGKGLVVQGVITGVMWPKADRDSETGLRVLTVTIQPTGVSEA